MEDQGGSRRKGRPRTIDRTRMQQPRQIRVRFTELLARKGQAEQRTIPDRELREVLGLSHRRIQRLRHNDAAQITVAELERLLVYFGCSLDELVQPVDAPAPDAT